MFLLFLAVVPLINRLVNFLLETLSSLIVTHFLSILKSAYFSNIDTSTWSIWKYEYINVYYILGTVNIVIMLLLFCITIVIIYFIIIVIIRIYRKNIWGSVIQGSIISAINLWWNGRTAALQDNTELGNIFIHDLANMCSLCFCVLQHNSWWNFINLFFFTSNFGFNKNV